MRTQTLLLSVAVLGFSGCNLFRGKCNYELRSLDAAGQISQGGAPFATAQFTLSEQRGSLQGQSVVWLVSADALKGHVTAASFKDSSNPSQVLLNLGLASAARPEISAGTASSNFGANLTGFENILVAGRGIIELQTDDPAQPTVTVPVTITNDSGWIRPNC